MVNLISYFGGLLGLGLFIAQMWHNWYMRQKADETANNTATIAEQQRELIRTIKGE